jgi:hypothetical protein
MRAAVVQIRNVRMIVRQRGAAVRRGVGLGRDRHSFMRVLVVLVVDMDVVMLHVLVGVDVAVSLGEQQNTPAGRPHKPRRIQRQTATTPSSEAELCQAAGPHISRPDSLALRVGRSSECSRLGS